MCGYDVRVVGVELSIFSYVDDKAELSHAKLVFPRQLYLYSHIIFIAWQLRLSFQIKSFCFKFIITPPINFTVFSRFLQKHWIPWDKTLIYNILIFCPCPTASGWFVSGKKLENRGNFVYFSHTLSYRESISPQLSPQTIEFRQTFNRKTTFYNLQKVGWVLAIFVYFEQFSPELFVHPNEQIFKNRVFSLTQI